MAPDPRRRMLQTVLEGILESGNVYFQPTNNIYLSYPCIVYALDDIDSLRADNIGYKNTKRYSVTVIDENPETEIPDKIAALPLCGFERFFIADNLNHYVFNLFF